jgi:chorismate mutase
LLPRRTPDIAAENVRPRGETHGFTTLKQAIKRLGSRTIDRRTNVGRALNQWRRDLIADLGGDRAISTSQAALVDLAVKNRLMLDSIDAWLLSQPSLVDKRRRALLPVVRERQQLADALARYVQALGLERRRERVADLREYLQEHYGDAGGSGR